GTGPNLYATMGAAKQSHGGFAYSGALGNTEGDWSWENMDAWLENPGSYARGTSMAFAGLKRDDERASVLAYLASYSPDAPAQPEPLPEVTAEGDAEEAAGDLSETDETVIDGGEASPAEDAAISAEAAADQAIEEAASVGTAAVTEATEAAETVIADQAEDVADAAEQVTDTVEEVTEAAEDVVEDPTPDE
ncbi:MAG: cytochrome C class I, partial [Pseudomonadota bacterium]